MEMTSAAAMMTSFPSKTSQNNTTSSGLSAPSGKGFIHSANVNPVSVSSVNTISATSLSAATSSPSVAPSSSLQTISTPVLSKKAPPSSPQTPHRDVTPTNATSVGSPQFNLKQGAISVQGLLGQPSFSSNTLDTLSPPKALVTSAAKVSVSQAIDTPRANAGSVSANADVQTEQTIAEKIKAQEAAPPSVAESFASIYGDDSMDKSEKQNSFNGSEVQAKQIDTENNSVDEAITKQAQDEQESKQRQDAIKQQEQQLAQKAAQIEAAQVDQLSKRDAEVKTHEQAHASVGGAHAQSPSFTYEKGPDGKRYAVDGEVQIDVSVVKGDAQATLNKMMKVYSAAMAPVQPSMADIRVAAEALQKMNAAREELAIERQQGVIKLDDADHIIGLGAKIKNAQEKEQVSQLEPFKKSANEPSVSVSGIDNTENNANNQNANSNIQSSASLAYQAFNANLNNTGAVPQASNINAYV